MNAKIWGIIGGVALALALLSPLVLGSSKKVENLFKIAEELYEHSEYKSAIIKYKEALEESKKFGVRTQQIDKDFTTLAYLKIAQCYYELGEETSDVRHYRNALIHIKEVVLDTQVTKHQEELFYLWAENLYKIGELNRSESKFFSLIERFPNSQRVEEAWYTIGNINYQKKNYDKALDVFQKLVDEFSNSSTVEEAWYIIGNINDQKKNYEEALRSFQKLLEQFPDSEYKEEVEYRIEKLKWLIVNHEAEEMYNAACTLKQQGKVHDAYQLYTDLITQFPNSRYYVTEAYVGKAEIHHEAEDYVNARVNYYEAIHNTDDEERRIELYEAYHHTYLVPAYSKSVASDPSGELFVEARLLRSEKRFLEAAKIYEQLANSNLSIEDMVYTLYWTGRCYHAATNEDASVFNKSVNAFKMLIDNYPDSPEAIKSYYHLTSAYKDWALKSDNTSKWQSVIDTVEQAITKYANIDDATVQGWLSRMQECKDEAVKKLPRLLDPLKEEAERTIIEAETEIVRATQENRITQLLIEAKDLLEHAKEEMHRNNYRAALNHAKEVLKIINQEYPPPRPIQRHVDEGYIHLRQGKYKKATESAKQALNLDPNYSPADELLSKIKERYYGLGWTFFDEEQYDKAIAAFKNAINIDPKFTEAHNHLAVVYIKQEKYTDAIKALEEAIKSDEEFKEAHFNLALAYLELSESEKAVKAANTALRIDPNYDNARMLIDFIAD